MIKIHIRPEQLQELFNFLNSSIKYEHTVDYQIYRAEVMSFPLAEVFISYEDYVFLENWKMKNRTREKTRL